MAENSFKEALSKWMDDNSWPPLAISSSALSAADAPRAILVITGATLDHKIFSFESGFGYFEITANHHEITETTGQLSDVLVGLVVPGYTKQTSLVGAASYDLSVTEGKDLSFDIQNADIIKGSVSFKYVTEHGVRGIAMTYNIKVPFAGQLEDTVSISPSKLDSSSGFTTEKKNDIPVFTQALSKLPSGASDYSLSDREAEHKLLLEFLSDFSRDGDKVVIETYYESTSKGSSEFAAAESSKQYTVSISFLSIFDLVGSVEPTTLTVAAGLFVKIPIAGRVRISSIEGSLLNGAGVTAEINAIVAKGSAKLTAHRNDQGKHDLYIDLTLSVKFIGSISSGNLRLLTLPF